MGEQCRGAVEEEGQQQKPQLTWEARPSSADNQLLLELWADGQTDRSHYQRGRETIPDYSGND